MVNLPVALATLKHMARLLDAHFTELAAPNRYERVTNEYETALDDTYQGWTRALLRKLEGVMSESERKQIIVASQSDLIAVLQQVGQEHLPYAVNAIGQEEYMPSLDAWRMIAYAIEQQNRDIESSLAPRLIEQLQRGVDEGTDLRAVADSLLPKVDFYAGNQWVIIQRLVGDFAAQASTRDDLIYPCRWVLDPQAQHCESCPAFAGEYESYEAMLVTTNQCVPGYFVGSPYKKSCWLNCRCHLELKINGKWTRV